MKKKLVFLVSLVIFASIASGQVLNKTVMKVAGPASLTPVGEWLFDDAANLTKATYGSNLVLTGTGQAAVSGPTATDGAVRIAKGSYYTVTHGIAPNNGSYVNTYSILFDFKVSAVNIWHCFMQTTVANNDDGDLFIKSTTGTSAPIGTQATNYSSALITANTWNRLVLVVNNGSEYSLYLNGTKILSGITQSIDGRFALKPQFLLFGDNDGDDGEIDIARVSIYDRALNLQDVLSLGGITSVTNPVGEWDFNNPANLTKSTIGPDLQLVGTQTAVDGPTATDGAVRIGNGNYYKLTHGITPKSGETYVNKYSLLFDYKITDYSSWKAFFQANSANTDDAELFVRQNAGTFGISSTGYSTKTSSVNAWNRLVAVVNNDTTYTLYLNGEKILDGTKQSKDGVFGLRPEIIFFGDNDGEAGQIDVSHVALYNTALSQAEVTSLGGFRQPLYAFKTKPYLQNQKKDGITVMWESDLSKTSVVRYGTTVSMDNQATATSVTTNASTYIYKSKITGLQPGTQYYYQVTIGDSVSKVLQFKTAPENPASFRVGIWGDSHNFSPFVKMATYLTDSLNVDFCFPTGDITHASGNSRSDLSTVFIPVVLNNIASKVPFYVSFGNHDVGSSWGGGDLIRQYIDQPSEYNSDPSSFNGSFAYVYNNAVFISVDWNRSGTDLLPNGWVENFLKSEVSQNAKFRFIMIHCAPFYERWQTAEDATIKQNIPLLAQKYGVNAVFSGHMHAYERGYLNGVQYITQGGGSYLDSGEAVGPVIYPHIIVGTNKTGNPANFNNGLMNHLLTLDVTADKATAKLHYFNSAGTYLGVIESVEMSPRTPSLPTANDTLTALNCSIFPNPTTGNITVQAPTVVNVSVFSLKGSMVYSQLNVAPYATLDLSALKKGTYLLKLNNNTVEYSTTLIKQ